MDEQIYTNKYNNIDKIHYFIDKMHFLYFTSIYYTFFLTMIYSVSIVIVLLLTYSLQLDNRQILYLGVSSYRSLILR